MDGKEMKGSKKKLIDTFVKKSINWVFYIIHNKFLTILIQQYV
jgi:hypothetical protein